MTNLLDEQLYPIEDFKELYHLRCRGVAPTPNAIKNYAFDLLYSEKNVDKLINKLEKFFLTNPTRYRCDKPPPLEKILLISRIIGFLIK